jgi:hypothetical protein
MKKILLTAMLFGMAAFVMGQDLDAIKEVAGKGQLDKAKDGIDKYLAVEKNAKKADGWFYKGVIYNEIAKSEQFAALAADPRMDAFNAFKKYQELDPKNVLMVLEQNVRLFDIYNGFFDMAAKNYNAKNYDMAFNNFKNAEMVQQYIFSKDFSYNGFSFTKLDTNLVLNTALAARLAKRTDESIVYYQKLADAKVSGEQYLEMYEFLVDYYNKKKDAAATAKYLALGQELYPTNDYWMETEITMAGEQGKDALYKKYEEMIARNPNKYVLRYNYSVEMYNALYTGDNKPTNITEMEGKMIEQLKKAMEVNPQSADAALLMTRHYYNQAYDRGEDLNKIKGTKPEDVKKKADLKALVARHLDDAIKYGEQCMATYNGVTTLKTHDKTNIKIASDILMRLYEQKKNTEKMNFYKKKMEDVDKM